MPPSTPPLLKTLHCMTGVLESPEDFESSEELYDAVGGMIVGAVGGEEEEEGEVEVHWICEQLFSIMRG